MNKYLFFIMTLFGFIFCIKSATAEMPFYDDDEEFEHCTKVTGNWDLCVREETIRALEKVKKDYRYILSNPALAEWHASTDENTEVLRDMYESWTAFRNRLCSLSNKASLYMERLIDEKYTCNLYYTLHHEDHLSSILQLLQGQAPKKRADFKFLDLNTHDDAYATCLKEEEKPEDCLAEELKRSSKGIKDLYKSFIEDRFVGKWNNGPSLKQGNYRDMYDSWIAYRNRICSLATWAYKRAYGKNAATLEQCLQFYNREKLETMENLLIVAHSALDFGDDEEEDEGSATISTAAGAASPQEFEEEIDDDGGEAEGKTITPLQKRFSTGSDRTGDELVVETPPQPESPQPEPEAPKSNVNIPVWAQQK